MIKSSALNDVIQRFEVPLPDSQFPELVAELGQEARRRRGTEIDPHANSTYFYLLGRTYELLGYCARHTPWLSDSPRFYWRRSVDFFEQAMVCTPLDSAQYSFLHGKQLLRSGMVHTLEKGRGAGSGDELLAKAEESFADAAQKETNETLRYIYMDASVIAKTEARHRFLRRDLLTHMAYTAGSDWESALKSILKLVEAFPGQAFTELPSERSPIRWDAQHALAKARKLFAQAHTLDDLIQFLRAAPKDHAGVADLIKTSENTIRDCYDTSAELCARAGLTIRASHTKVTNLRRRADVDLRTCIRQFAAVRSRDAEEREELLRIAAPRIDLPADIVTLLQKSVWTEQGRENVGDSLHDSLHNAGVDLRDDATILKESDRSWVVSDGVDRYVIHATGSAAYALDLTKQPIAFNHSDAERFRDYSNIITGTCEQYTEAIREIHRALEDASELYAGIELQLKEDAEASDDPDLASLNVSIGSILSELKSRHYPLLDTLRDRIRYAWSLLEMFQMRNGSVRLGTIFSGQCRLVMRNPFFRPGADEGIVDELLEVGADPVFATTIDFVFRGAKGEENRHDSQRRALKATRNTIDQQEHSLLTETRYVDLDRETRRALIARLRCHRSLALALDAFTQIFVVQTPGELETHQIEETLETITSHMNAAEKYLENAGEHRSKLIDIEGLDALHLYMKGVGTVLIGMNQHKAGSSQWKGTYQRGLDNLRRAKERLAQVGDVDLLPVRLRDDYLHYVQSRILTVSGWQARYRGEEKEKGKAAEFVKSADFFDQSADLFNILRDYRVATKARARATHVRSMAEMGQDSASRKRRYLLLKQANALYAACGDAMGFDDSWHILQRDFPIEEAGAVTSRRPSPPLLPSPAPKLETAEKTFAGYEVEILDNSGGMAIVYKATKNEKVVALKRVRDEHLANTEYIQRFKNEVNICHTLSHPNIIRIFEHGENENGVPYFTMELLAGKTLQPKIDAHLQVAPLVATRIIRQIAEALDYAHHKGVVHRDLKPSNVMLLDGDLVKVLDFGIARSSRFPRITKKGFGWGTPEYASPEQLRLEDAAPHSDLYSLGIIFYELLTGLRALPFEKRMRMGTIHPAPEAGVPSLSPLLNEVVNTLLAWDPKDRYESAEELIQRLDDFFGPG